MDLGFQSKNPSTTTTSGSSSASTAKDQQQPSSAASNLPKGPENVSITLPKGGGAISGMGEKLETNPVTGTAGMTIPIVTSNARDGHGPGNLVLSYSSGAGNSPFGLGWSLASGGITRKTDKGVPLYGDGENSDVFLLSGADDLVPVYKKNPQDSSALLYDTNGQPIFDDRAIDGYTVRRYSPRVETNFTRIERWTSASDPTDVHWRTTSPSNLTTIYGRDSNSRVVGSARGGDGNNIMAWLPSEAYDSVGNATLYTYKPEDSDGIDLTMACERNRTPASRSANRYIKSIRYGNRQPNRDQTTWLALSASTLPDSTWMFEVIFDYGEHDEAAPTTTPTKTWPVRMDPFSTYRSGFDIRTYRLCRRVLMFHHFPDELGMQDCAVFSTTFNYDQTGIAAYLTGVTKTGFRPDPAKPGAYITSSMPPVEMTYSKGPNEEDLTKLNWQTVDPKSTENLPVGLQGSYMPVDLYGEGLTGVLVEASGNWFYKRNLSPEASVLTKDAKGAIKLENNALFGPALPILQRPNTTLDAAKGSQFMNLAGDGRPDLVDMMPDRAGFYELDDPIDQAVSQQPAWTSFRTFKSWPSANPNDPNAKLIDITGDGLADLLFCQDGFFIWYQSLGKEGFGPGQVVTLPVDDDAGPRVLFSDPTHAIFFADMTGDGLVDIVQIQNSSVCYWPNCGYGVFGNKITMDGAPVFEDDVTFDQRRIRLADIEGSGVTDMIYLTSDEIHIYYNLAGNAWSDKVVLSNVPPLDDVSSVQVMDLLGRGTSCLVWSSPLPSAARSDLRYLDLTNGIKPHLLVSSRNNLGAEMRLTYTPSTKFYLDDEQRGQPWATRLPFVVHCVSRTETYDAVSQSRFVCSYAYHHGFYDGFEREFRGFGMVEAWDTETHETLNEMGTAFTGDLLNWSEQTNVPPVLTKTWYHTGAFVDSPQMSAYFAQEYYGAPDPANTTAFAAFLATLPQDQIGSLSTASACELREACYALHGVTLRQEVYAQDGSALAAIPYSTSTHSYSLRRVQPQGGNLHPVWFTHPSETIAANLERNPGDALVSHDIVLEVDDFGNDLRAVKISYGRTPGRSTLTGPDALLQERAFVTYKQQSFTNMIDTDAVYRLATLCESFDYEITGLQPAAGAGKWFTIDDFAKNNYGPLDGLAVMPFETASDPTVQQKRLLHRAQNYFRSDDLTKRLPLGQLESLAITAQSFALVMTPGIVAKFQRDGSNLLPDLQAKMAQTGYVDLNGDSNWWAPTAQTFFSPQPNVSPADELKEARAHFFIARQHVDIWGNSYTVDFDKNDQLPVKTTDPVQNTVTCVNDYRVLQPVLVTDINGNQSQVVFDAMGKVVGSAIKGKVTENLGDSLEGFQVDLAQSDIDAFFKDPKGPITATLLNKASTRIIYDYTRFYTNPGKNMPAFTAVLARETHASDPTPAGGLKIRVNFSYSDGYDREIQQKGMAEPGQLQEGQGPVVDPRWVGTGWSIFNNKGNPVQKFEPFFDDTHDYKFDYRVGVSSTLIYDAAGRPVCTLQPDHSWTKTVITPWDKTTWDASDLTMVSDPRTDPDVGPLFKLLSPSSFLPSWYDARSSGQKGQWEQQAAQKSVQFANTPTAIYGDSLGHAFLSVQDNGSAGKYSEHTYLDVSGNRLSIVDSLGRTVCRQEYDMLGQVVHQVTMDAGESWMLNDATTNSFLVWDDRGSRIRTTYDGLRRVVGHFLQVTPTSTSETAFDVTEYGEAAPNPQAQNLRGQAILQHDQAGTTARPSFDFKGNVLQHTQQLCAEYKALVDWGGGTAAVPMEADVYTTNVKYDALNRIIEIETPDKSIRRDTYNEASFVDKISVAIKGELGADGQPAFQDYVTNIDYDEKGQRKLIAYGNGAQTTFEYDPLTFNLTNLRTTRGSTVLQDNSYTYDQADNVTHIEDAAQQTLYFQNQVIDPSNDYTFDAIGRLIQATGREHISTSGVASPPTATDSTTTGLVLSGPNAMGRYTENYTYDSANNILQISHNGSNASQPGWTRTFAYNRPSRLEPSKVSNRLSATTASGATDTYKYDGVDGAHGLMTSMPHLSQMTWNFKYLLQSTSTQVVNSGTPETTYYVYNGAGERVRKVTERASTLGSSSTPTKLKECIYLGVLDVFRKYAGDGVETTLEKETFKIQDSVKTIALVETTLKSTSTGVTSTLPQRLVRYSFSNNLGSISLELDQTGQILSYEEYLPFGSTSFQAFSSQVDAPKRYRHAGKERDQETGLYYYGARYYAPWIGRWVSPDPEGIGDGLNVFCYVQCNPIKYRDGNGKESQNWRDSLSWGQRAALWVDDRIQEHPGAKGVVDNLEKRGAALMNMKKALHELAQKPAGEIAETVAMGMVQLGKDTVQAGSDTLEYGGKAIFQGGDENWEKFGSAATDLVLNTADVVSMVDGVGSLKSGAVNLAKGAVKLAEPVLAVSETGKTLATASATAGRNSVEIANAAEKGSGIFQMAAKDAKEAAGAVKKGGRGAAEAAKGTQTSAERVAAAVKDLQGDRRMARWIREFKEGAPPPEAPSKSVEEAMQARIKRGSDPKAFREHHTYPQELREFLEAKGLKIDWTKNISQPLHDVMHGYLESGFPDANKLWAYELSKVDLATVTAEQLMDIEKKITAIYGPALTEAETVWFKGAMKSSRGAVGVAYGGTGAVARPLKVR